MLQFETEIQSLLSIYSDKSTIEITITADDDVIENLIDESEVRGLSFKHKQSKDGKKTVITLYGRAYALAMFLVYVKGLYSGAELNSSKRNKEADTNASTLPNIDDLIDKRMC